MRHYDPDQVTVSFAGIVAKGFADGEFVAIEQPENSFDFVVGTDGEMSRSKTGRRDATVTIKLMQTSPTNDQFSAILRADLEQPGGAGVGALMIRDRLGRALYRADAAFIQKAPDVSFDRTATAREWVFVCENLVRTDGGN